MKDRHFLIISALFLSTALALTACKKSEEKVTINVITPAGIGESIGTVTLTDSDAGLVLTPGRLTSDALMALRPYARILLVPAEEDDLLELLRAIRA